MVYLLGEDARDIWGGVYRVVAVGRSGGGKFSFPSAKCGPETDGNVGWTGFCGIPGDDEDMACHQVGF